MKNIFLGLLCFFFAKSLVMIIIDAADTAYKEDVTRLSNNKYSITLEENAIIWEGRSRKPSPQDEKDHLAEITARMKQGGLCTDGFVINSMLFIGESGARSTNIITKHRNFIKYTIDCK